MKVTIALLALLLPASAQSATLIVKNVQGEPLAQVMVTRTPSNPLQADLSDDGYAPNGVTNAAVTELTRFSNAQGAVSFAESIEPVRYRARAQGYVDAFLTELPAELVMQALSPEQLPASYPSNVWLSQLDFGGDAALKKTFQLNCAYCHQQASIFMRNERTEQEWLTVFERMQVYGSRLPSADHQRVASLLRQEYRQLRADPSVVPAPLPWQQHLSAYEMTEWQIGDGFSQMHDFLLHPNGHVYVGDNLFDRIYELDPNTNDYTVYKVPHEEGARVGGIMGNRFKIFPKMYNYQGVHSFAYSQRDGNIFITPSMQQSLLEFDVETRKFIVHEMPGGYYPHTIRIDDRDRVWFTLALSSQVAMFDRITRKFTLYDLPARGWREWLILKSLPLMFSIDPDNRPMPSPDQQATGLPMPYGIDIAPNGIVWVARLYANDIARIDPQTGEVTMIEFPFRGPRRLRADADGNLWIVAFQDSLLVKYDPVTSAFTSYELPVVNEVPYALNVDRERGVVWVNGNQSDTLLAFDIAAESWKVFPLPRQRFFGRDVEISATDGAVYTTNSHFPTWQSEGGVPTLLRLTPLAE